MVIQRWQSVWLLVAAILMAVFCFIPIATNPGELAAEESATLVHPLDFPLFFVINGVIALLLFLAIFMYRNTARQRLMTLLSMLLICVSGAVTIAIMFGWGSQGAALEWTGAVFLLLGALVSAMLAYRGIRHDERLLRAADRLR